MTATKNGCTFERKPRLGKAQLAAEVRREDLLRGVVGDGEASGDADNVLRASAPKGLVHLATDELVEGAVVHLRTPQGR